MTQQLADFVVQTRYEDLPDKVVHEAKRVLLDSIGCALAGMATDKGKLSAELAQRLGGPPESSVLGTGHKVSCTNASFANGELITALDYDATLRPAVHVSPFVLPPCLALSESRSASGKDLIVAIILGHEITSRVAFGLSSRTKFLKDGTGKGGLVELPIHGYSSNIFGSVASAGKALNLDRAKMVNAFGIAGYNAPMQASGQRDHSGTDCLMKWASAGWFAQAGTTAALLAEIGYTGDAGVLDGDYSFWRFSGSEEWHPEVVLMNLGEEWHILNTRYKHYPCCGLIIRPLDLFMGIIDDNKLNPGEIQEVKIWMDPTGSMPLWQNREIYNEVQAQFSVAYAFAVAAYGVTRGIEWQELTTMKNSSIGRFMEQISVAVHPDYEKPTSKPPTGSLARVAVTARGRVFVDEMPGSSAGMTNEDDAAKDIFLVRKFKHNASKLLSDHRIDNIVKSVWTLEETKNISSLVKELAR